MTQVTQPQIEDVLRTIIDPHTDRDAVRAELVDSIDIEGSQATVKLTLGYPAKSYTDEYAGIIKNKLVELDGLDDAKVIISWKIASHSVQKGVKPLQGVKNIIAVASGKGGVGKSTVAVNLASALSVEGARVGILDADIYGPSQPRMLGVSGKPESEDGKTIQPMKNYDLQAMSIGFLVEEDTPMIWRGPMVTQALEQLLKDTAWDDLDYLIIDLPPGTGDIQLTLAQRVPVSGAVIVTTPQDIALIDARKAVKMFEKVDIPILGVIENMSTHICSSCGHEEHIFGEGGGQVMADDYDLSYLGAIPLDIRIREDGDKGKPTVVNDPEGAIATAYRNIARLTAGKLASQKKDYSAAFPSIVIENT